MARILVVDDEPAIRDILGRLLRAQQHEVFFAADGLEGLKMVAEANPNLILMDIQMPKIDGVSLCHLLKSSAATAHVPIVFVTSVDKIGSVEEALAEGADGYIIKPFDAKRLTDKLNELLRTGS